MQTVSHKNGSESTTSTLASTNKSYSQLNDNSGSLDVPLTPSFAILSPPAYSPALAGHPSIAQSLPFLLGDLAAVDSPILSYTKSFPLDQSPGLTHTSDKIGIRKREREESLDLTPHTFMVPHGSPMLMGVLKSQSITTSPMASTRQLPSSSTVTTNDKKTDNRLNCSQCTKLFNRNQLFMTNSYQEISYRHLIFCAVCIERCFNQKPVLPHWSILTSLQSRVSSFSTQNNANASANDSDINVHRNTMPNNVYPTVKSIESGVYNNTLNHTPYDPNAALQALSPATMVATAFVFAKDDLDSSMKPLQLPATAQYTTTNSTTGSYSTTSPTMHINSTSGRADVRMSQP